MPKYQLQFVGVDYTQTQELTASEMDSMIEYMRNHFPSSGVASVEILKSGEE